MIRFLSDEDFNNRIVRGLRRRLITIDIVRVQDVDLAEKHDTEVLRWAAEQGRIVLTHDAATMIEFAYDRIAKQLPMPGVIVVSQYYPIGDAIEEVLLLAECSMDSEWEAQIIHLPIK
jgi:hypothetical protein